MTTFTIDAENSIAALMTEEVAAGIPDGTMIFTSDKELLRLATDWPAERLVEIWNGIPGVKAVTRFTSRKGGVGRIWKAIQPLARNSQPSEPEAPKAAKAAKKGKSAKKADKKAPAGSKSGAGKAADKATERTYKKAEVITMMKRAKGVTLAEIMEATGWQAHTVRGFVSILGSKGGHKVESSKNAAGERTYKIAK